jgi:hypothetical protein
MGSNRWEQESRSGLCEAGILGYKSNHKGKM